MTDTLSRLVGALAERYRVERELGQGGSRSRQAAVGDLEGKR